MGLRAQLRGTAALLLAPLVLLSTSVFALSAFRCSYDSVARASCCCPHHPEEQRPPERALTAATCCKLETYQAHPVTFDSRQAQTAQSALVALPAARAFFVLAPPAVAPLCAHHPPPGAGPPIHILTRSLLI